MPESKTPIGRGSDKLEDPKFLEIEVEEAAVDRGELGQIGKAHLLVDLVDGRGQEAELNNRAHLLDEACVRSASVSGKRGRDADDLAHRLGQSRVKLARLGEEGLARRLEDELVVEAAC